MLQNNPISPLKTKTLLTLVLRHQQQIRGRVMMLLAAERELMRMIPEVIMMKMMDSKVIPQVGRIRNQVMMRN